MRAVGTTYLHRLNDSVLPHEIDVTLSFGFPLALASDYRRNIYDCSFTGYIYMNEIPAVARRKRALNEAKKELNGAKMKGIYKLEGDQLTCCWGAPGASRPKDFSAPQSSNQTLIRLQKK